MYSDGTAADINSLYYITQNDVINNVNPGVFFYYTQLTAPAGGDFQVEIQQISSPDFTLFEVQNDQQIRLFNPDCSPAANEMEINAWPSTLTIHNAAIGQHFILSLKYGTSSVVGYQPVADPIHYDFATFINGGEFDYDYDGLDLKAK
jgi:hypothetical protein